MTDSLSKLSTFLHKKMQKTIVKKSLKDNLQQDFGKLSQDWVLSRRFK